MNNDVRILRLPHVREACGISRSELYRRVRAGTFPAPVKLGTRAVGWRASEIFEWIAERPTAKPAGVGE